MATLSRIARIRITTGVGDWREWTATAATEETVAGSSVTVTWTVATSGVTPPEPDTAAELRFYTSAGVLLRTIALTADTTPQTASFFFTANGQSGGGARSGTVELAAYAARVVAGTTVYEVESDGTPSNAGTGNTATTDRGYIVGTTTATASISNVAYAGAKTEPAEHGESLFYRLTLGARAFRSEPLTLAIGSVVSANVSSATATYDLASQAVDDRFPASLSTQTTGVTVPNNTGFVTGRPWTTITTSTTSAITVDPRLTAVSHLWQMDDDQVGTPPMSKHEPSKAALVSSYSGLAWRLVTARTATGVNGLSTSATFDPRGSGANIVRTSSTATRGGEAGWTELGQLGPFVVGGAWDATLVITAPASIDAPGYVLSNTDVVTILAPDPRIQIRGYINLIAGERGHLTAGAPVVVNMTVRSHTSNIRIDPSRVTEPRIGLLRYRPADHRLEYLDTDLVTWVLWEPTSAMSVLSLAPSPNDPRNYILEIPNTTGWTRDITSVEFFCKVDGTPYSGNAAREETGAPNDHLGYSIDPIGLALSGVLSTR